MRLAHPSFISSMSIKISSSYRYSNIPVSRETGETGSTGNFAIQCTLPEPRHPCVVKERGTSTCGSRKCFTTNENPQIYITRSDRWRGGIVNAPMPLGTCNWRELSASLMVCHTTRGHWRVCITACQTPAFRKDIAAHSSLRGRKRKRRNDAVSFHTHISFSRNQLKNRSCID